jgi:hemolysin activation/secretion protein
VKTGAEAGVTTVPGVPATTPPTVVEPAPVVTPAPVAEVPAPAVPATPVLPTTPPIPPVPSPEAPNPAPGKAEQPPAVTPPANPPATQTTGTPLPDDQAYPLTGIKINYLKESGNQVPLDQLMDTTVKLGITNDGYTSTKGASQVVTLKLRDIGTQGVTKIYRSGIAAIYAHVIQFFNQRGYLGVFVAVDRADIDIEDKDVRPADRTTLQFVVVTARVRTIRTLTRGKNEEMQENLPRHQFIKDRSPIKADGTAEGRMDLLNKDVLDNYVFRLNRHPGRRIDVAVSGTPNPGEVNLDYLIAETRPWYVYSQISNTGTKQTDTWRERFGAVHNQLTGNDDILMFDYLTAGFEASHALVLSYNTPVFHWDRLRYKIYGSYSEFTASDVGQGTQSFTGDEWTIGNELSWNVFQHRELFVDVVGGFRYQSVRVDNASAGVAGDADFCVPYASVRLQRSTNLASTTGALTLVSYNTGASQAEVEGLGRSEADRNPVVLQFEVSQSAYLEPLLDPEGFASGKSTLAHEAFLSVRGQYGFGYRMFPQAEEVAGGFYSVRGYPESIVAGDSVVIATAEYRLHIPRLFPVEPEPSKTPFLWNKSFRFSPPQTYGKPDWDLITRAFVDVAHVVNNDKTAFENNSTLVGTGLGLELQYKQHLNFRVDWGIALTDVEEEVRAGSNRFHFSATFLY